MKYEKYLFRFVINLRRTFIIFKYLKYLSLKLFIFIIWYWVKPSPDFIFFLIEHQIKNILFLLFNT